MSATTHTVFTFTWSVASNRHVGDLGEVAAMRYSKGTLPIARPAGNVLRPLQPARSATALSTPSARCHASKPSAPSGWRRNLRRVQQIDAELNRVLSRRVRQLVDERLEHPGVRVAARRAHRPRRHAQRHQRCPRREIRHESRGKLRGWQVALRRELLALAVGHIVIAPRDDLARRIQARLQVVPPSGPIVIVMEVIFAGSIAASRARRRSVWRWPRLPPCSRSSGAGRTRRPHGADAP